MKYSEQQLRLMLRYYFAAVADENYGERADEEEIDRYAKNCRFSFNENYSWDGAFPPVDVLFLLAGAPKNYQAFTIEDGMLVELHQEHQAEYCLTCISKEQQLTEQEAVSSQPF